MGWELDKWPWQAIASAIGGLAIIIGHLARLLYKLITSSSGNEIKIHERGWERASELEKEIILLRKALHRQSIRGNAYSTISEILLLAMPMALEDRVRAVQRARVIAEASLDGAIDGDSE